MKLSTPRLALSRNSPPPLRLRNGRTHSLTPTNTSRHGRHSVSRSRVAGWEFALMPLEAADSHVPPRASRRSQVEKGSTQKHSSSKSHLRSGRRRAACALAVEASTTAAAVEHKRKSTTPRRRNVSIWHQC